MWVTKPRLLILLALLIIAHSTAADEINITGYLVSAGNNAVGGATLILRDDSDNTTIETGTSNATTGAYKFEDVNTTAYPELNIKVIYPSSGYTSALSNTSCPSTVYLDDYGSIRVTLKNTLGEFLEGQDGNVFVTEAGDASKVIKSYDTQCKTDEPYLDGDGNWASYSNCPFTDSRGNYVYRFEVKESDGYFYGENYTVHAILNGQETICDFTIKLPKGIDRDKYSDLTRTRWGGYLTVLIFLAFLTLAGRKMYKDIKNG